MNTILSKSFDYLRFPLSLLVIYIHIDEVPKIVIGESNLNWSDYSALYYICTIFIAQIIARLAVPCFFFISGYLFFINVVEMNRKVYWNKIKKRIFTLFIPYILWNILGAFYYLAIGDYFIQENYYLKWICWMFLKPADFPLWFVRDLIIMSLCTPVFFLLIKYLKRIGLIIFGFIYLFLYSSDIAYLSITSLFLFYIGAYYGFYKINLGNINRPIKFSIYVITFISIITKFMFYGNEMPILNNIYLLAGVFSLIFMTYDLMNKKQIHNIYLLSSASFFIFAIHRLGITGISKVCLSFLPNNYGGLSIKFFICPLITALLCLILYVNLKKYAPKILYMLTGGK